MVRAVSPMAPCLPAALPGPRAPRRPGRPRSRGTSSRSTCAAARNRRPTSRPRWPAAILDTNPDRVWLEPWAPSSASCVWRFDALFWQALVNWEKVAGREYGRTLPGGESDARNADAARETILDLFKIWDELARRRALPDQLYVLELGVGSGGQAGSWLDEFAGWTAGTAAATTGGCSIWWVTTRRMCLGAPARPCPARRPRVSPRARRRPALRDDRISCGEAFSSRSPTSTTTCRATRWPPPRPGLSGGGPVFLPARRLTRSRSGSGSSARVGEVARRLRRTGPGSRAGAAGGLPRTGHAVMFWLALWSALRQAERYVPLEGLDTYQITRR